MTTYTRTFIKLPANDGRKCLRPTAKRKRCLRHATGAAIIVCEDGRKYEVLYCEEHGEEAQEDFKDAADKP